MTTAAFSGPYVDSALTANPPDALVVAASTRRGAISTLIAESSLPPENFAGSAGADSWLLRDADEMYVWFVTIGSSDATQIILRPQQARTVTGTGVKSIDAKVITLTTLTTPAAGTDNHTVRIELLKSDLDVANGFSYARLRVEVTGGTTVNLSWVGVSLPVLPEVTAAPNTPARSIATTLGNVTVYDTAGRLTTLAAIAAANTAAVVPPYSPNKWTVGRDPYANGGAVGQTFFNNKA
jgi:hypothetical protein